MLDGWCSSVVLYNITAGYGIMGHYYYDDVLVPGIIPRYLVPTVFTEFDDDDDVQCDNNEEKKLFLIIFF